MEKSPARRRFLKSVTAIGGAASFPVPTLAAEAHAQHGARGSPQAYLYLTRPEVAFVEAAVARLIPADELGPGAKEAGVAYFIDRQLFGGWGTMAKMYRQGPWPEGTPQQGYQSPLTPPQVYRIGIGEVNAHCAKQYGHSFSALTAAQQGEVLRGLDAGKIELEAVRSPCSAAMTGGAAMATKLKPVDVAIVGVGLTGTIMAKELAESGLKVVGLERGHWRDTDPDFAMPYAHDELRFVGRHELMQDLSRET